MKRKTWFFLILCILLLPVLVLIGGLRYKTEYRTTEIETSQSEDGTLRLSIYAVGEPAFPFGPGKCRLVLFREGRRVSRLDLVLYNDGKWPDGDNFSVSWLEDRVLVLASGEEQEDCSYTLYYDGRTKIQ